MKFFSWLKRTLNPVTRTMRRQPRFAAAKRRKPGPSLETLEVRIVPAFSALTATYTLRWTPFFGQKKALPKLHFCQPS
jgi:hypothetical protein